MELIKWDELKYQIENSKDIEELTQLKDRIRAYQILAEQSKQSVDVQAKISIYKARIDRKCGEWLKENIKHGGQNKKARSNIVTSLKEINLSKNESSRLQKVADIPEKKFEGILNEAEEETKKVTNNMLVKIAREIEIEERNEELRNKKVELPDGKYNVIYADPPWQYGDKLIDGYGSAEHHYPSMSIDELCKLEIPTINNAILFLWVTSPLLEESFEVIKAWNFQYKTSFIWDKVKHNFGHYNSVRHEFLLVCTKGNFTPEVKKLYDSVITEERTKIHSQKPKIFYEIIETLYPNGKYLELFARNKFNNKWTIWGNEI